eukprot:CAMPEP_0174260470 /NCGR_PEP_ID=MMETSP0439-20130205/9728_1 /TAXON_ID=0 /ORGANISM="Stereomyxa ramosa, Strain Chinc5" /LENGTH=1589 /DNA_ID=CAMNT_0015344721 /DNA_START=102 /DNA_END=4868 /DNA_ORIENTATION=+
MKLLFLIFVLVASFPLANQQVVCVVDEDSGGGIWDELAWDCGLSVNRTLPEFQDTAVIRNVSVTLDSPEFVDGLLLTDAAILTISGGSITLRTMTLEEYSTAVVDFGTSITMSSSRNFNITADDFSYIKLTNSKMTVGTGELSVSNDELISRSYISLSRSYFSKGAGDIVISTSGNFSGEARLELEYGSIFEVEDDLYLISYDVPRYYYYDNEFAVQDVTLYLDCSYLTVYGNVALRAGRTSYGYGGEAYVRLFASVADIGGFFSVSGGDGGYYTYSGRSHSGGYSYVFSSSSSLYIGGYFAVTGGNAGAAINSTARSDGGEALVRIEDSKFSTGSYIILTGGAGGRDRFIGGEAVAGNGGSASLRVLHGHTSFGGPVTILGGVGGDNYGDVALDNGDNYGTGGFAELELRNINAQLPKAPFEENLIDVDFLVRGGNAGSGNYKAYGGDAFVILRGPSSLSFSEGSFTITSGDSGSQLYRGYGGEAGISTLIISNTNVEFTDYFSIYIVGGVAGSSNKSVNTAYGGEATFRTVNSIVYMADTSYLTILGGSGGYYTLGSGGEASFELLYSEALFSNNVVVQGGSTGQDTYGLYEGTGRGGAALSYIFRSRVLFEGYFMAVSGAGTSQMYASNGAGRFGGDSGPTVIEVVGSSVWFQDVIAETGNGGDSYNDVGGASGFITVDIFASYVSAANVYFTTGEGGAQVGSYAQRGGSSGWTFTRLFQSKFSADSLTIRQGNAGYAVTYDVNDNYEDAFLYFLSESSLYLDYSSLELTGDLVLSGGDGGDTVGVAFGGGDFGIYSTKSSISANDVTITGGDGGSNYLFQSGNGGEAFWYAYETVISVADVTIVGGTGGGFYGSYYPTPVTTQGAGSGGNAKLYFYNNFIWSMGNLDLTGGDAGIVTNYGNGGSGGVAKAKLFYIFSDDDQILIDGFLNVAGGDGTNLQYFPIPYQDYNGLGGAGGLAYFSLYYAPTSLSIESYTYIIGGDAGRGLVGQNGGYAELYTKISSLTFSGNVLVSGGDGGDVSPVSTDGLGGFSSGEGGDAYVSFYNCLDGGNNITGSLNIFGGDSGRDIYQYGVFVDYVEIGNGGTVGLTLRGCKTTHITDFIALVAGSSAQPLDYYSYYSGYGGFASMLVQYTALVVDQTVGLFGGSTGPSVYAQDIGGGVQTRFEHSLLSTGNVLLLGGSTDDAYYYAASGGPVEASFFYSVADINYYFTLTASTGGQCISSNTNASGYSAPAPSLGLYFYFSVLSLNNDLTLTGASGVDSCRYGSGSNGGAVYFLSVGSFLSVDDDIIVSSGNAGNSLYGPGGDAYAPFVYFYLSTLTVRSIYLSHGSAGNSGGGFSGGDIVGFTDTSLNFYMSDFTIREHLTFTGGDTGSATNTETVDTFGVAGEIYWNQVLAVGSLSNGFIGGNVSLISGDHGAQQTSYNYYYNYSQGQGDFLVVVSGISSLEVEGSFELAGSDAAPGAYHFTGTDTGFVITDSSSVWLKGPASITGGDGEGLGDGGNAYIQLGLSTLTVDDLTLTPGSGDDDGRAYIIAESHSELNVGGELTLVGTDAFVLQRASTLTIFDCDDANLVFTDVAEGFNWNLW